MHADKNNPGDHDEFARAGAETRTGLVAEFFDFLRHNKKWWLLPILAACFTAMLVPTRLGDPPIYDSLKQRTLRDAAKR